MVKKTATYEDFNGVKREEDFYFHLSKDELIDMKFSKEGGLEKYIEKIIRTKDTDSMIKYVKELILKSYGVKSDDGTIFEKSKKIRKRFKQSKAYEQILMSLMTNEKELAAFFKGILPEDLAEQAEKDKDKIAAEFGIDLAKSEA